MDAARVYETLLSSPGMSEMVKLDLRVSRRTVLLLNKAVERGLLDDEKKGNADILTTASKESLQDLSQVLHEALSKAGLLELYEKLKSLSHQ